MVQPNTNRLIEIVKSLEGQPPKSIQKKLNLKFLVRVLVRLDSFSLNCLECQKAMQQFDEHIHLIAENPSQLNADYLKLHKSFLNQSKNHLFKVHKLVTEGYYTNVYMSLGISLGLMFGLVMSDNVAIGLPIGLAIGLAIGSAQDADAKKKDRVI